jgi:hypothetical protein
MVWVIWLQLTMTIMASAGRPVPAPTVHRQQLPWQYATQRACEDALVVQRQAYGSETTSESNGMTVMSKAELWCAREGAQR